jgi:hypothetical protein
MSITINNSNVTIHYYTSVEETASTIDGHYWVERDGVIVGEEYLHNMILSKHTIFKKGPPPVFVYRAAEPAIQARALKWGAKKVASKTARELETLYQEKPDGMCLFLAMEEARRNGGEVRFGAFGLADERTDYKKVYWYFGHSNFSRYEDYFSCDEINLDKSKTPINDPRNFQFNPRPVERVLTAEELEEKRKAALASWDDDVPVKTSTNKPKKSNGKKRK